MDTTALLGTFKRPAVPLSVRRRRANSAPAADRKDAGGRRTTGFGRLLTTLLAILGLCWGGSAQASEASEDKWQVGLSAYSSSGTYGTGSHTTITSIPLSIRRLFDEGDLSLTIPYLSVTGDCDVTLLSGVPNQTGGTCPTRTVVRNGRTVQTRTLSTRTTETGIGDMLLQGRYYVLDEQGLLPTVALTVRVKFPTADASRGLGTGEFDEKFGVQLSKNLSARWVSFADVGYTFVGSPPGVELRNQWNYDVGLGYALTPDLLGSVYYEYWTAVIPGLQAPQDLYFDLSYTAPRMFRLNAGFLVGLSDGAPDYGVTGGLAVRF